MGVAVFIGAFVALGRGGTAGTTDAAVAVPPSMVGALVEAAHSCPALTPPRLAGQVMEASGFASTGDLADFTAEEWEIWAPWSGASRQSARDNIFALAHLTCDLVGHIRVAGLAGEPWRLAVAASESSVDAVKEAGGVPSTVAAYVDRVEAYAAWYALQPAFGGPGSPTPTTAVESQAATPSPSAAPPSNSASAMPPSPTVTPTPMASPPSPPRPTPIPTPTPVVQPPRVGAITGPHGFCLDVPAQITDDGNPLQLWECNGSPAQQWTIGTDGTVRALGKCMDNSFSGTNNGNTVHLWHCFDSTAQQWVYDNGLLKNPASNKCLQAMGPDIGLWTRIVIWDCDRGPNQLWTLP
jgi:hypothetical protein